jgi:predicted Holliday junction resolvase-like endonuclease
MALLVAFLVGLVAGLVAGVRLWRGVIEAWGARLFEGWRRAESADVEAATVARSEAVLRGRITEQLAPMFDDFAFDPADARFIGSPIDFVVFDGLGDVHAGRADRLRRIVLLDVKTGRAGLTAVQRKVRACVEAGAVTAYRFDA